VLGAFKAVPFLVLVYDLAQHWRNLNILRAIVAVIFGAAGDLFLEYGGESLFNLGAASFLVGHVLYNLSIIQFWKNIDIKLLFKRKLIFFVSTAGFFSAGAINLTTTL